MAVYKECWCCCDFHRLAELGHSACVLIVLLRTMMLHRMALAIHFQIFVRHGIPVVQG